MEEALKALKFYRTMLNALKTEGVEAVILTMENGEITACASLREDGKKEIDILTELG